MLTEGEEEEKDDKKKKKKKKGEKEEKPKKSKAPVSLDIYFSLFILNLCAITFQYNMFEEKKLLSYELAYLASQKNSLSSNFGDLVHKRSIFEEF